MTCVLPPIEDLLPHRGSMLLLDRVVAYDAQCATAHYAPRARAWYANAQHDMPAWIGMELMAQTIAAHVALVKRAQGGAPKHGALLGTRRYAARQSAFPCGRTLAIEAKMVFRDDSGLGAYECRILQDGQELAHATLKVFEPENFETFIQAEAP